MHLLPRGKREGENWVCGNLDGQPGRSLKVNIAGKPGVWADFAGDGSGKTLMSLWCSVRSQPFKVCIVEAKDFLGLRDDFTRRPQPFQPHPTPKEEYKGRWTVEDQWPKCQPLTESGPVWKYLVETRKIDPVAIEAFRVQELPVNNRWVMIFPYYALPGNGVAGVVEGRPKPEWLKFEALDRPEGKKVEWTTYGPEKSLWGLHLAEHPLFKKCRHVLICEGEKDALTWATYGCMEWGILPVSVPFGAKKKGQDKTRPSPNREWIDLSWEWLQGFETVFVAMDADEAGRGAAADIIGEIGPRRCRLVGMPEKVENI